MIKFTRVLPMVVWMLGAALCTVFGQQLVPAALTPGDGATDVDVELWSMTWALPDGTNVEDYTFDLYLGITPAPPLFRGDVYNGWVHASGWEAVGLFTDDPVVVEYMNLLPFLAPETTYYWKIVVKDGSGPVAEGSVASFTTGRANSLPSPPTLLSPADGAQNVSRNVTLQWTESVDADGDPVTYQLYFGTDAKNPHNQLLLADNLTTKSYTFPAGLDDQQTYYWSVITVDGYNGALVAHDGIGKSWSFTIENYANDAPTAPLRVAPADGAGNIGNNVLLAWSASSDAENDPVAYDLYLDKTGAPSTLIAQDLKRLRHSVRLDDAGTYQWRVVAKDVNGATTSSEVFSFTTWTQAPPFTYDLVPVEGGTFTMGQSDMDKVLFGYMHGTPIYLDATMEQPAHSVTIPDFQLGKYMVTNIQFVAFLNAFKDGITFGPSWSFSAQRHKGFYYTDAFLNDESVAGGRSMPVCQIFDATQTDRPVGYEAYYDSPIIWDGRSFSIDPGFENHPVRFVYFDAARQFAQWLGMDLPTEAEWEYAAMGGEYSHGYTYSGSNTIEDVRADDVPAIFPGQTTQPVGTKMPNELGIYDMSGNVGELCLDIYNEDSYKRSTVQVSPVGSSYFDSYGHTIRGLADPIHSRVKARQYESKGSHAELTGFRLVKRHANMFTISGFVRDKSYRIPNVILEGLPSEVRADRYGSYFTGLPQGWSGTIAPRRDGYVFSPAQIVIENLQADQQFDFTGTVASSRIVSGRVTDASGNPVPGVEIQGALTTTVTDENGNYTFEAYTGWSGTLKPARVGYSFTPATRSIVNQGSDLTLQHFSASFLGSYSISGHVTDPDSNVLAGVQINGFPQGVVTDTHGHYQTLVTSGWFGSIAPVLENYAFIPAQRDVAAVSNEITDLNFIGGYVGNYLISGTIRDDHGLPVQGAQLTNGMKSATTNAAGQYVFSVAAGWAGTITPALTGYLFEPPALSFPEITRNAAAQDFVGTLIVLANEAGIPEITVYPNPTKGKAFVKSPYLDAVYSLRSSLGTSIPVKIEPQQDGVQMTLDNVTTGVYILTVETGKATILRKIVVTQ